MFLFLFLSFYINLGATASFSDEFEMEGSCSIEQNLTKNFNFRVNLINLTIVPNFKLLINQGKNDFLYYFSKKFYGIGSLYLTSFEKHSSFGLKLGIGYKFKKSPLRFEGSIILGDQNNYLELSLIYQTEVRP